MDALILMTRVPVPGQTKTRLMEIMTGEECAKLHTCFLKDLMDAFHREKRDFDLFVTYTPEKAFSILSPLLPAGVEAFPQSGGNLGERMANGMKELFAKGYEKVLLIGSDIPDLAPGEIKRAFSLLDDDDVVLGPTYDGGYYLIGMKAFHEHLFHIGKEWGGKSVFEATVDKANRLGLSTGLAAKHLDIDTKEDLFAFYEKYKDAKQPVCLSTMAFIEEWKHGTGQNGIANS